MAKIKHDLISETATAILEAIRDEAPTAAQRSTDGLESLAKAFAVTVEAMPNAPREGHGRSVVM